MDKRSEVFTSRLVLGVLLLVALVVVVPTLITLIFSPTYTAVVLGLTLLLGGGFALYAGIKQLRATTSTTVALV